MTASGRWTMNSSGVVSAEPRGTTTGSAESSPTVTVTVSGQGKSNTSTATATQAANTLGTTKYKNTSGTEGYNVVYVAPQTCSITSSLTAANGTFYVTCAVTNNTNWYQKYSSGSYTSLQSGTEAGTARWRITSNGNSRFSNPSTGGSTISVSGSNVTVYPSGSSYPGGHSTMGTDAITDTVTVTAYNVGDTSKTKTATASVSNSVESITLKINGKTDSTSVAFGSEISASNIVVIGTYTSGDSGVITPSGITSSDTSVATVS